MERRTKIFISYSHADDDWLKRVLVHLKPLERMGLIDSWADTRIRAGDQWQNEIETALGEARAAILLVSPGFYASDYIAEQELPPLLAKAEAGGTRILILVLDHCRYQRDSALRRFQAVHDPGKPLKGLSETEQNRILDRLAAEIERLFGDAPDPGPAARPNPYQPRKPVVPPLFVGRRAQLHDLGLALDRGESVSLVGDWRIGKSSLLATWALEARRRGRVVKELSGEGPEGAGIAAFVRAIIGAAAPEDPDAAADALDAWARAQGPLPPLLLVDEAGHLLRSFDSRFWSRVRGMLERIGWVFATRVEIREVSPDSPLVNRLGLVRLGLLEPDAAEALIAAGGLGADRAGLMHEWAGRHPFYLQLLGRCLGDHQDAQDALDHFRDEAGNRLAELWDALAPRDREALGGWPAGRAMERSGLRLRGLVDEQGRPFGRVLTEWLNEQN